LSGCLKNISRTLISKMGAMKKTVKFSIFLFALLLINACTKPDNNKGDNFNRSAFLQNAADELIIPAFNTFKTSTANLKAKTADFTNDPTLSTLTQLQDAWLEAAMASQLTTTFNFGPADSPTGFLTIDVATFPANTTQIENFVSQMSDPNFNPLNNFARDTRGLFGIEYLIYDINNDQNQVLERYTGTDAGKYKAYLEAIADDLHEKVKNVADAWPSYKQNFVQDIGISAGSSMSVYYNQFLIGFENLKNFKLGVPLGLRAGQSGTEPTLVEAYYSGKSVDLLKKNFEQVVKVYFGTTQSGANGIGFDDYLNEIEGGAELLAETIAQLDNVNNSLAALSNTPSLSFQISSGNTDAADNVHLEMSKWTRFVKSDLSSLLGISITFSSGDGD
jgi:uncharacterized protein